nr:ribonuclease H-like domain, reverse transcriptase, RNA-dependent DNA polymerase [Tanacetum cinerariifolium]
MSSIGELTFFLGLQLKQKKDGIFISQDKYVAKTLKKFSFIEVKTASTSMKTQKPLLKDENCEEVDVYMYRLMIGSLMYLTSLRPDIVFTVKNKQEPDKIGTKPDQIKKKQEAWKSPAEDPPEVLMADNQTMAQLLQAPTVGLDSSDCTLAELRTNCDREHSKVFELEAEVLKRQHMLTDSEKRYAFLENEHNDGFKVTNATQKTEIAKLKAKNVGNKSSGTITPTNPKVSTSGEKVEDHPRNLNKQNRVDSHLNAKCLVSISNLNVVCGACHECLFLFNDDKCVVYSMNSVKPKATPNRQTTKKVWKQKVVAHAKPQWMPTRRHFTLYDSYPLTRILDLMEEPLELSPSVSSSSNVTMLS